MCSELRAFDPGMIDPMALSLGALIGFVGIGLGAPGNPHIVVRYISMNDPRQFRYAAAVGTTWNVLMATGAVFIGLVGRAYMPEVGDLPGADPENLLPVLAQAFLPPVIFGIVVAAIFAAIMSTANSQLLVMASTVVRDVYQQVWRKDEDLDEGHLVLLSRIVVALLVVIALALGFMADELVFWLVLFAVAGLGVGSGTAVIWFLTPVGVDEMFRSMSEDVKGDGGDRPGLDTGASGRGFVGDSSPPGVPPPGS